MRKLPLLKQIMGKPVITVDLATFAGLLQASRNRFFRVIWESNQNARLKKTGPGAEYKGKDVRKLYILTARNGYNFRNSMKAELERRGATEEAATFEAKERTWGAHIPNTPFVIHQCAGKDGLSYEPERLYGHFLPAIDLKTGKHAYHFIDGETGYYVDGEKIDDKTIRALEYERKKPTTVVEVARDKVKPVNARLDDVLYFKIAGSWYRLKQPTYDEIEALADAAVESAAA